MNKYLILIFLNVCFWVKSQQKFEIIFNEQIYSNKNLRLITSFDNDKIGKLVFENGKDEIFLDTNKSNKVGGEMNGEIYPIYFSDKGENNYKIVFINKGLNYIGFDTKISKYNKEQSEIKKKYLDLNKVYATNNSDSIKKASLYNDQMFLDYVKKNKNSLVAFYVLADRVLLQNKSNYLITSALDEFSKSIKVSSSYKYLKQSYDNINDKNLFVANSILLKKQGADTSTTSWLQDSGSKYKLIDFWFSYCSPCLAQMPRYSEIYSSYKNSGFEIIGISTDRSKDVENWKKIINEKKIEWIQYLDENGVETKKINVNKFPTNYLLDSNNVVIKKDISLDDLEDFLNKNLSKN